MISVPTEVIGSRVTPEQLAAARQAAPELAHVDASTLIRVSLAVLAGRSVAEALAAARPGPRGPKPGHGGRPPRQRAEASE
jgi:hypothetical protein